MRFINISTVIFLSNLILCSCGSKNEVYKNNYTLKQTEFIEENQNREEKENNVIFKNQTFKQNIKTVLCHKKNDKLSQAIINLSSNDKLLVSFDDLDGDKKDYLYTFYHCNSDWSASNLMQNEYINGFTEEYIENYEFSFNTIQKYTHYQFEFPTQNIKPILSGNYILKVFEENGGTIFYKRFMVLDKKVHIDAKVRRATLAKDRNTKHEIDFTIKHPKLVVSDPFQNIKVHIKQNNREDNAITDLKPQFVRNDELIYDYEDDNLFFGNNEFRYFDFKSLRYQSEKIKDIYFDSSHYHVNLFNDKKRSFDLYSIDIDINGKFFIESQEGWNSSIEADYAFIQFTLPSDYIIYGDLYILGALSDWELKEDFRLIYNKKKKKYEKNIYLKQGYYNYHYALNDTTTNHVDVSFIEGTFYQTRNDYYIYVYYRDIGDKYDKLVGFLKSSSKELF